MQSKEKVMKKVTEILVRAGVDAKIDANNDIEIGKDIDQPHKQTLAIEALKLNALIDLLNK